MAKIVHEHKVVLSPLRRVSSEILSEIFLLAAEPEITLDTARGSWLTAQVSKRWRSMAISMPRLWSSMCIVPSDATWMYPELSLSIIFTILCRSGNALLDIIFETDDDRTLTGDISVVRASLELLIAVCHRWRTFKIGFSISFLEYLCCVAGNVPHLECLSVRFVEYTSVNPPHMVNFSMFSRAPKLHTVDLGMCRPPSRRLDMDLPWSQITNFEYEHGTGDTYSTCNFLTKLVNVRHLKISEADAHTPEPTGSFIRLDHLHCLDIDDGSKILDHLTLPVLDGLHFHGVFTSNVMERMARLFHRTPCRLTRLKLSVKASNADSPVALFQVLGPSLVEFNLLPTGSTGGPEESSIMNLLTLEQSHAGFIFPRLTILKVDISQVRLSFNAVSFSNAMKSRITSADSCLRTLSFRYHPTADPLTLENIENLPLSWNA